MATVRWPTSSAEKTTQVFVGKRLTPILRSKFGLMYQGLKWNEAETKSSHFHSQVTTRLPKFMIDGAY